MKRMVINNSLKLFKLIFVDSLNVSIHQDVGVFTSVDLDDMDDVYYLSWTDEQLSTLSLDEIHQVTDVNVLLRLAEIDKSKLTKTQLTPLYDSLNKKQPISVQQIQNVVDMLHSCTSVEYHYTYSRTNKFLADHNIRDLSDCLPVLHSLSVSDVSQKFRGTSDDYLGDILLVFNPAKATFGNGEVVEGLGVYVKVDISRSGNCTVLVTMHDPKYPMEHPLK